MTLSLMRYDYGSAFPVAAKLLECSVFVWIGQSTVSQPIDETRGLRGYNSDDVIPFSRLSQGECVQTKKYSPRFHHTCHKVSGILTPQKCTTILSV